MFLSLLEILHLHFFRWLVTKHREKEAHFILSKINHQSQLDRYVDTDIELEELKEASGQGRAAFKEILKWKYMSRYYNIPAYSHRFCLQCNITY